MHKKPPYKTRKYDQSNLICGLIKAPAHTHWGPICIQLSDSGTTGAKLVVIALLESLLEPCQDTAIELGLNLGQCNLPLKLDHQSFSILLLTRLRFLLPDITMFSQRLAKRLVPKTLYNSTSKEISHITGQTKLVKPAAVGTFSVYFSYDIYDNEDAYTFTVAIY